MLCSSEYWTTSWQQTSKKPWLKTVVTASHTRIARYTRNCMYKEYVRPNECILKYSSVVFRQLFSTKKCLPCECRHQKFGFLLWRRKSNRKNRMDLNLQLNSRPSSIDLLLQKVNKCLKTSPIILSNTVLSKILNVLSTNDKRLGS